MYSLTQIYFTSFFFKKEQPNHSSATKASATKCLENKRWKVRVCGRIQKELTTEKARLTK